MKISYNWLKWYVPEIPDAKKLADLFTYHVCEVESLEEKGDDTILDIKILPNRAHDLLSHQGIAKEIASLLQIEYKDPSVMYKVPESKPTEFEIRIETDKCRRYMGRIVRNVKIGDSPDWVKGHLESIGQRSISNIVDASNITMFDCGQPCHVFDADKLKVESGKLKVIIRNAKDGEKMTTIDNREVTLTSKDMVIADEEGVLAIAGVKGGKKAEVDVNTKNIIIEVANFDPISVRKTAKSVGIQTDAVKRYENDLSPELCDLAMKEISGLFVEYGAKDFENVMDLYPRKRNPYMLGISSQEASRILGIQVQDKDIEDIFTRYSFAWKKVKPIDEVLKHAITLNNKHYKYGASVSYDAPDSFDCSSFTSFIFAQAGVQIPRMAVDQYVFGKFINKEEILPGDMIFSNTGEMKRKIDLESREFLPGTKIPEGVDHCGIFLGDGKIIHATESKGGVVMEPLVESDKFKNIVGYRRMTENEERFVITVPSLRLDLRIKEDLVEEIGRVIGYDKLKPEIPKINFQPKQNETYQKMISARNKLINDGYTEVMTYAFASKGEIEVLQSASDKKFLRTNLSDGLTEAVKLNQSNLPLLGMKEVKIFEIGTIFKKNGEEIHIAYGNKKETTEMSLDEFTQGIDVASSVFDFPLSNMRFASWSLFPFIVRDIAVWVPENISGEDVMNVIKVNKGDLAVKGPELFDQFKKDGKISYAFRIIFQSYERTLSDAEVNPIMEKISAELTNKGWQVR